MNKEFMEKIEAAGADPSGRVKEWKENTGGKAVGTVLTDVPEELLYAAGALPVTLLGRDIPIRHADKHLQGFACGYSRSLIEALASGEVSWLDGVIIPYACDTTRCMDLIVKFMDSMPFYDCLRIPRRTSGQGVAEYYRQELGRLAESLAAFTGKKVTDRGLSEAVEIYNRVREKLEGLRKAMREQPGSIPFAGYLAAVRAAMTLPPETSLEFLDGPAEGSGNGEAGGPRVVVAGKMAEPPGIAAALEDAGLTVIEDHLAVGGRWVEAKADEGKDPWDALVERQFRRLPFSGIWDSHPTRADYLIHRVKELKADGAVFLVQKFCEPAEIDYPGIHEELEKQGIPLLSIQTDLGPSSIEQVRTRVEAFAEMLKNGQGS